MDRKTKTLLYAFLALLVAVLAVTLWPKRTSEPGLKVAGWSAAKKVDKSDEEGPVDRIDVDVGGKKVTLARSDKARWTLTPPEGARADRYKVRQILDLFQGDVTSVVSSRVKDADLAAFGLDAAGRVAVTLYQGGVATTSLEIGQVQKPDKSEGPGEPDTFVRVPGQDRAWRVISKDLRRPFDDGVKGLRDRKLFDWDAGDVTALAMTDPGAADPVDREVVLASAVKAEASPPKAGEKKDDHRKPERTWRFEKPAGLKMGDPKNYLASLAGLYATEFADALPDGATLPPDAWRIAATLDDGRKVGLAMSADLGDSAWVSVDGTPGFAKVSKYTADQLRKHSGDLRDKTVFGVDRADVTTVEIVDGGRRLVLDRVPPAAFKAVEPAGLPVSRTALDALMGEFETLKADAMLAPGAVAGVDTGLDAPAATITLKLRDGTRRILNVGKEKDKNVFYAALAGQPLVLTLPQWSLARIRKSPADLRNRKVFDFEENAIASVELALKDETVRLEPTDGAPGKAAWKATAPQAADLKAETVRTLVSTLTGLTAKDFAADRTVKTAGLAGGQDFQVTVTLKDGSRHAVRVSAEKKDGDPYAVAPTEKDFRDTVFTLNQYQVRNLQKRLAELR
jgi:hypothetical protein